MFKIIWHAQMVLMGSATTLYGGRGEGSQTIKRSRTREKILYMSNPFFYSGKMSVTMCLGMPNNLCFLICILLENYPSPL